MHRFYLPPEHCLDSTPALTGDEAHHALHVLRLQPGDAVTVLDGAGTELACEITHLERDQVLLLVVGKNQAPAPASRITLLQGVPKGKTFEWIIQKAAELGVWRVIPLLSERAVPRLEPAAASLKTRKWQRAAIEAIKQCGSLWLPKIELPVAPVEFLARHETFDLPLVASLLPGSRHPRACFSEFQSTHGRNPASLCIWIGPEGDFTGGELSAIQSSGAQPITLGPLVLRADTAAVYCLSILNYELLSPS